MCGDVTKVAIVTESFIPRTNGVTGSVCRIVDHLSARGDEVLVVAPGPGPQCYAGTRVARTAAVGLPIYPQFPVGLPTAHVTQVLDSFGPDIVHLASPISLGVSGLAAAKRLGVPSVAVFQTDVAAFARRNGVRGADALLWGWLRHLHTKADLTLAPSSATRAQLVARRFPRVALWGRGVDTQLFDPRRRSTELRRRLAPDGEVLVGYVGRLAPEKRLEQLERVAALPGIRLAIVGDGPAEQRLRRLLPEAAFLGCLSGSELATAYASLDVFVHPGRDETFCQTVQEAHASGVPVVACAAGGPLDLVAPGHDGFLVDPDDPEQLAAAVAAVAADPALRARMGANGRSRTAGRTWDVVCDELVAHYAGLLQLRLAAAA
jgi:phosphatidylinositol alpha 1,6-mannosyltransferase